jgi:hypothetical protein
MMGLACLVSLSHMEFCKRKSVASQINSMLYDVILMFVLCIARIPTGCLLILVFYYFFMRFKTLSELFQI